MDALAAINFHFVDMLPKIWSHISNEMDSTRRLNAVASNDILLPAIVSFVVLLSILFLIDIFESKSLSEASPAQSVLSNPRYLLSAAFDVGGTGFVLIDENISSEGELLRNAYGDLLKASHREFIDDAWMGSPFRGSSPFIVERKQVYNHQVSLESDNRKVSTMLASPIQIHTDGSNEKRLSSYSSKSHSGGSHGSSEVFSSDGKRSLLSSHSSGHSAASSSVFSTMLTIDEDFVQPGDFVYSGRPPRGTQRRVNKAKLDGGSGYISGQGTASEDEDLLSDILLELGVEQVEEIGFSTDEDDHNLFVSCVADQGLERDVEDDEMETPPKSATGIVHVVRQQSKQQSHSPEDYSEELTADLETILKASAVIHNARKYHNEHLESYDTVSKLGGIALPRSSLLATTSSNTLHSLTLATGQYSPRLDIEDDLQTLEHSGVSSSRAFSAGSGSVSGTPLNKTLSCKESVKNAWATLVRAALNIYKCNISPFVSALLRHSRYIRPFTYASMHRPRTHRLLDLIANLLSILLSMSLSLTYMQYEFQKESSYCNVVNDETECNRAEKMTLLTTILRFWEPNEVSTDCKWVERLGACEHTRNQLLAISSPGDLQSFIHYFIIATIITLLSILPKAWFHYMFESVSGKVPGIIDSPLSQSCVKAITRFVSSLCCVLSCGYCVETNPQQQRWGEVNRSEAEQTEHVTAPSTPVNIRAARGSATMIPKRVSEWSMSVGRRNVTKYAYCDFVTAAEEVRVVFTAVRDFFSVEREKSILPWAVPAILKTIAAAEKNDSPPNRSDAIATPKTGLGVVTTPSIAPLPDESTINSLRKQLNNNFVAEGRTRCESMMQNLFVNADATPEELTIYQKLCFGFSHKNFTEWRIRRSRRVCDDIVSRMTGYAGAAVRDSSNAVYDSIRDDEENEGSRIFEKMYWRQSPFAHGHKFCMQLVLLQTALLEHLPMLGVSMGLLSGPDFGLQRLAALRAMYQYDGFASARMWSLYWFSIWLLIIASMVTFSYVSFCLLDSSNHGFFLFGINFQVSSESPIWNAKSAFKLFLLTCALDFVSECIGICLIDVKMLDVTKPRMQRIYHVFSNILKTMEIYSEGKATCLHGFIRLVQHLSPSCRAARCPISSGLPVAEMLLCIDDRDDALCKEKSKSKDYPFIVSFFLAAPMWLTEILLHLWGSDTDHDRLWMVLAVSSIHATIVVTLFLVIYGLCRHRMMSGVSGLVLVFLSLCALVICYNVVRYVNSFCYATPTISTGDAYVNDERLKQDRESRRKAFLRSRTNLSRFQELLLRCFYHESTDASALKIMDAFSSYFKSNVPKERHVSVIWRNMNMLSSTRASLMGITVAPIRVPIADVGDADTNPSPAKIDATKLTIDTTDDHALAVQRPLRDYIPTEVLDLLVSCEYDRDIAYIREHGRHSRHSSSLMKQGSSKKSLLGLSSSSRNLLRGSSTGLKQVSGGRDVEANRGSERWVEMANPKTGSPSHKRKSSSVDPDSPIHSAAHNANSLRMVQLLSKQRIYRATNKIDVSLMRAKRIFKQISTENEGTVVIGLHMSVQDRVRDIAGIAVGPHQANLLLSPRSLNSNGSQSMESIIYFLLDAVGLRRVLELALSSFRPEGVPLSLNEIVYFFDQLCLYVSSMKNELAQIDEGDDDNSFCSDGSFEDESPKKPPHSGMSQASNISSSGGEERMLSSTGSTLSSFGENKEDMLEAGFGNFSSKLTARNPVKGNTSNSKPKGESNLLYDKNGNLLCVEMYHFLNWYRQMCNDLISTRRADQENKQHRGEILSRALPLLFGKISSSSQLVQRPHVPLEALSSHRSTPASSPTRHHMVTRGSSQVSNEHRERHSSQSTDERSSSISMSSFFRSPVSGNRSHSSHSNHSYMWKSSGSSSSAGVDIKRNVSVPISQVFVSRRNSSGSSTDSVAESTKRFTSIRKRSPRNKELKSSLSVELQKSKMQGRGLVIDKPGVFSHSPDKLASPLPSPTSPLDSTSHVEMKVVTKEKNIEDEDSSDQNAAVTFGGGAKQPSRIDNIFQELLMGSSSRSGDAEDAIHSVVQVRHNMKRSSSVPTVGSAENVEQENAIAVGHYLGSASSDLEHNLDLHLSHLGYESTSSQSTVEVLPRNRKPTVSSSPTKYPPRPVNKRRGSL